MHAYDEQIKLTLSALEALLLVQPRPVFLYLFDNYSKYTWCLTSTETVRLIRDGKKGGEGVWRGGRGKLYTCRYNVTTRMIPTLEMGSDESHFNVSVGSDGQTHKTVSTNHNLFEEKGEPKRYRTEVLPLTSL